MSQADITIYHNPRCSKSRATLAILEEKALNPTVIKYLDQAPSTEQLSHILSLLGLQARELMRQGEAAYKENQLDDPTLSEAALIEAMVANPILIERPIVLANGQARIGRPPESVLEIV